MSSLIRELKRRKVFRVAVVYAATAFVVLQAADLLAAGLRLPDWVFPAVTVMVILGFPVALVLGWALELTPEGIRRTEPSPQAEAGETGLGESQLPAAFGRGTLLVTAGLVLVGIGLGAGWFLRPLSGAPDGAAYAAAEPATEPRSLAVLPFVDLSEAADQKWFADGLAEEILTSLARLPELRVVGRGSSFLFTTGAADDRVIADTLGVAHLVKGSVRRVDGQLRVTAQLVRAADGVQLWSEAYDRAAADLLAVQRDVAEKVATALDVLLDETRRDQMFAAGTRNVEAFEAFLRGREIFFAAHAGRGSLADANVWFERALALDPRFGRAAMLHADRYTHRAIFGPIDHVAQAAEIPLEVALDRLRSSLDIAARHAPDPYWRVVAEINREFFAPTWHRLPGLIEELRRHASTAQLSSDDNWLPFVLVATRNLALARELTEGALRADPLEPIAWYAVAQVEMAAENLQRARSLLTDARRIAGDHPWLRLSERLVAVRSNDRDAVVAWVEGATDLGWLPDVLRGDAESVLIRADALEAGSEWPPRGLVGVYHQLGERQRSRNLVQRIDALPTGPAILAVKIYVDGGALTFDPADAPNFSARLREAGVDLASFPVMPRLSAGGGTQP